MRNKPIPVELQRSYDSDFPYVKPDFAMFNVVRRCNAGCQYCTDWRNDADPRTDPALATIKEIIDGLGILGVNRVAFSGGEPFLRRDLSEIVSHAAGKGMAFGVITNGTAATRQRLAEVCAYGPEFIGVSVDSLDSGRLYAIRKLPLAKVMSTVEALCEIRRDSASAFDITLQVTVLKDNIDDLPEIARYAHQHALSLSFQPVHYAGSGTPESVLNRLWPDAADIARLETVVEELLELRAAGAAIKNRVELLRLLPEFFRRKTFYPPGGCTVAYTDIVIDTEFGLRPCWSMEPVAILNKDTRIEDAWFAEPMRHARMLIRQEKCPGCLYKCHMNKAHLDLPLQPKPVSR